VNIKKYLKPNMTVKDYAAAAGVSPTTAQRELTEAVEMGFAEASAPKAKNLGVKYSPAAQKNPAIAEDSNWAELVASAEESF
jgi:DeoR/GlpR family transcriptional regulator of sugar metabolism